MTHKSTFAHYHPPSAPLAGLATRSQIIFSIFSADIWLKNKASHLNNLVLLAISRTHQISTSITTNEQTNQPTPVRRLPLTMLRAIATPSPLTPPSFASAAALRCAASIPILRKFCPPLHLHARKIRIFFSWAPRLPQQPPVKVEAIAKMPNA